MDSFTFHEALTVFFTAMLPYLELRGAIPLGIALGATPAQAFLISLAGNLAPVLPIMVALPALAKLADRVPALDRFFVWLTAKVGRKKNSINRFGPIGLALFVAVPLPVTGAWTGAALAFFLGIRKRHAFPAIVAGVIVAGVIVTAVAAGAERILQ